MNRDSSKKKDGGWKMFTVGDAVKVRTPISNLWFNAFLIAKDGDKYIDETFFPVQAQTRWTVNQDNIQKIKEIYKKTAGTSPALQNNLKRIIKKISNNNNKEKK